MGDVTKRLSGRVRAERARARISRRRLAVMAGITYSSLRRIEDGEAVVDQLEIVLRIARALGVSSRVLIEGEPVREAAGFDEPGEGS